MDESIRFLLNLQMIADELMIKIPDVQLYAGEDKRILEGICFYQPGMEMVPQYAYIARAEELKEIVVPEEHDSVYSNRRLGCVSIRLFKSRAARICLRS